MAERSANELRILDHLADEASRPRMPAIEGSSQHVTAVLAQVRDALVFDPVTDAWIGVVP